MFTQRVQPPQLPRGVYSRASVRVVFALAAVALVLPGCRSHLLEDGDYAFTTVEVLRDDCGAAESAPLLQQGRLTTTGDLVQLAFGDARPVLQGTWDTEPLWAEGGEALVMDGSLANVEVSLGGRACRVDWVTLHLVGQVGVDGSFGGSVSATFDSRGAPECNCAWWWRFSAERVR